MSGRMWRAVAGAFRRTAPPLASYYAITLVVPLANGAAHAGTAFTGHALIVLTLPPVLIVLACAIRAVARIFGANSTST